MDANDKIKVRAMREAGYKVNPNQPDDVKFEVAKTLGIPLQPYDNGNLTSKQAGKVGGAIGGKMVKEMIKMAQQEMKKERP